MTDVKHLNAVIRPEEVSKTNSPWNIAADFKVRMTFDGTDVAGMLEEYERDHPAGMDVDAVTREGVNCVVRRLLEDDDMSLFNSLTGKIEDHPTLKEQLCSLLMRGGRVAIANRVFEMLLYDYYLAEEQGQAMKDAGALGKSRFVRDHFPTAGSWS